MKPETEKLKALVALLQGNQTTAAEALGISQSTVSRMLREEVSMHGSTKLLLEKLLEEGKYNNALAADQNPPRENLVVNV